MSVFDNDSWNGSSTSPRTAGPTRSHSTTNGRRNPRPIRAAGDSGVRRGGLRFELLARGGSGRGACHPAPNFIRDDRRRGMNSARSGPAEDWAVWMRLLAGNDVGSHPEMSRRSRPSARIPARARPRIQSHRQPRGRYLIVVEETDEASAAATNFDLEYLATKASALLHQLGRASRSCRAHLIERRYPEARAVSERFAARELEWTGDMMDEAAVSDDRRVAVSGGVVIGQRRDREADPRPRRRWLHHHLPSSQRDPGDRLALVCRTWHDPHGFDLPLVALMEFTDAEQMISNIMWDLEDLDTAYAEMDGRYLAGEGERHREILEPLVFRFIHCYNTARFGGACNPAARFGHRLRGPPSRLLRRDARRRSTRPVSPDDAGTRPGFDRPHGGDPCGWPPLRPVPHARKRLHQRWRRGRVRGVRTAPRSSTALCEPRPTRRTSSTPPSPASTISSTPQNLRHPDCRPGHGDGAIRSRTR